MPPMPDMGLVGYGVYSWCSDPDPTKAPPEAVVLALHVQGLDWSIGLRMMRSRAAVDQLIDALERHSVDVWGVRGT